MLPPCNDIWALITFRPSSDQTHENSLKTKHVVSPSGWEREGGWVGVPETTILARCLPLSKLIRMKVQRGSIS